MHLMHEPESCAACVDWFSWWRWPANIHCSVQLRDAVGARVLVAPSGVCLV